MMRVDVVSPDVLADARQLITEVWPVYGPASEMHVGDLYWALFHRRLRGHESPVALWYDAAGALQGMTLFPGQTWCDVVIRPAHLASPLSEEIVAWAERECRRKNPQPTGPLVLRIGRRVTSPERLAFLERMGFERMNFGYLALAVDAHTVCQPGLLQTGFVCRPLQAEDIPGRVAAYNLAFPGEDLSVEDYATMRSCPGYDPTLDLVVVDPSGAVASFCTLWLDDVNRVGLVEPVGCHPEFRRRGLAQYVMLAGLQRLWARGAKQTIVRVHCENTAAQQLYQSCGFSMASTAFGHEKRIV
jgi:ribosomal protein S18 acetylase RimI-like enzyme